VDFASCSSRRSRFRRRWSRKCRRKPSSLLRRDDPSVTARRC
jgi:hypothetical protein